MVITEDGKEAVLPIKVDANPPPEISWEFQGNVVNVDEEKFEKLADGSLKIKIATLNDTGTWTVIADNNLGQIARKIIALEVTPERIPLTVCLSIFS